MNVGMVCGLIKAMEPGIDPADVEQAVSDWLDEHPEATTTVQDGSITEAKLAQDVLAELGEIEELKEAIEKQKPPVEYKFSGDDLLLGFGYTTTIDAVIVMNNGRANGLFDFNKLCTKAKGTSLEDLDTADLTSVWSTTTDHHGPFQFLADANADGYHADATTAGFVGGNHTLDDMGTGFETASSVYVHFYADGSPVSSGYGKCANFEIRWANDVQAYNTVKQGGGGRACLREYHDMIFDGEVFRERITLKALEAITLNLWYGLQCVSIGSNYTNIAFVDATNRETFLSSASGIKSGNAVTSGFIGWGDDHRIEMNVNTNVDLGKRTYYSGDKGAFVSSTKGYFTIINTQGTQMASGAMYYLDGSYRFMPNIAEESGDIPCTGITLNKNTCSFTKVGDTDTLTATLTPENTTDTLTWESSDENVATVVDGVVTIHGIGTATITATCGEQTATASVAQTTIKAENAYVAVTGKTAGSDGASSPVLVETSNETQAIGGQAYHSGNSDLHLRYATDIECIRVPYGATTMKYTTSGSAINYIEIVDTEDIVTKGGEDFPKWLSNSTYPSATNGFTVEYGQAFVFRGSSQRIGAVSEVYFE